MASSRRRKAKTPTAPVPQAPRRPGIGVRFLDLLQKKPLETLGGIGAIATALSAAVSYLGFLALRARETLLLGPAPGPPSYPEPKCLATGECLVTGLDVMGGLLWRGFSVLVSDHPVLQRSAWALLLLLVVVLAARSIRKPALLLGILGVSILLLVVGSSFYRIALPAKPDPGQGRGLLCGERLSANLADRAAFETCSWLVNDTEINRGRRVDFSGLLGWLLAACFAVVVAGARAPVASRWLSRLRWVLVGALALVSLLLVHDLPRAHAFGTWGLRHPQTLMVLPIEGHRP